MPEKSGLNQKQLKFALAYLENGGDASAAYKAADYGSKGSKNSDYVSAFKLLRNPKVRFYLEKQLSEIEKSALIRIENKRNALWDIAQDGMQKIPVKKARKFEIMHDPKVSVSAIHELNRMDGHHKGGNSVFLTDQIVFGQVIEGEGTEVLEAIEGELVEEKG